MIPNNNRQLPPSLVETGIQQLTATRCDAMVAIAHELQALLPSMASAAASNSEPEGIPAWAAEAFAAAGMNEDQCCWDSLHEHLSRRTAELVGATSLAGEITGESLADFLGVDLYALASEGWSMLKVVGPSAAEGAL